MGKGLERCVESSTAAVNNETNTQRPSEKKLPERVKSVLAGRNAFHYFFRSRIVHPAVQQRFRVGTILPIERQLLPTRSHIMHFQWRAHHNLSQLSLLPGLDAPLCTMAGSFSSIGQHVFNGIHPIHSHK